MVVVQGGAPETVDRQRWALLGPRLELHAFDADPAACAEANRSAPPGRYCHALCLGRVDGQRRVFHLTRARDASGLHPSLEQRTQRWKSGQDAAHLFQTLAALRLDGQVEVETVSLDGWRQRTGVGPVDFLNLAVQGAELEVLQGAERTLDGVLGLEVSVNFVEVYEGQPLFADVDAFLRARGFTFFNLLFTHKAHFVGRARSQLSFFYPGLPPLMAPQLAGQLVVAHAVYLRDPLDFRYAGPRLSVAQRLKLAILAETYGQVEFAIELLHETRDELARSPGEVQAGLLGEIIDASYTAYRGASVAQGPEGDRPFGGDRYIAAEVRRLVRAHGIRTIVESGTFRGATAAALGDLGLPVHTIEIDRDCYQHASAALAERKNVTVHHGCSAEVLPRLLEAIERPALFYLDAHWNDDWPLLTELGAIARHGLSDAVIVFHDVQVPGQPFGFDEYQGQPLSLELLAEPLRAIYPDGFAYHYNEQAEGDSRGVLYVEPRGG